MSTKPFKKVISSKNERITEPEMDSVKPFKVDSKKDIDTSKIEEPIENILDNNKVEYIVSSTNFFSTFNGVIAALFIFIVIVVFADAIDTLNKILINGSIANYIYLSGLLFLLVVLFLNIFSNIKQLKFIQNSRDIKQKFLLQKDNPSAEIVPLANFILNHYSTSKDDKIIQSIEHIREELNTSQIYKDIYENLDIELLQIMDAKAKKAINAASIQAALSTAISPFPLFDMLLILWRSISLTKEISIIYGFRPGGLSTIILLKQAVINVAFAGVSELASEFSNEVAGSTLLAKISQSAGQGVANGILLARLGYGIMKTCRPIEISEEKGSFVKNIVLSILKTFKVKKED